jgi:hypothetical protein
MKNPDHISERLKKRFWVKILKFFDANLGSGMGKLCIWDPGWKDPGSATLVPAHSARYVEYGTVLK